MDNRLTFGVNRAVWTLAAKMVDEVPWRKGVLQGAENFMTFWHKEEEEASRRRATKRDSESSTTEITGKGRPEQNWLDCLKDDFQAFGATDGSTVDNRLTFGVNRAVWTLATKMDDGVPWHKGVHMIKKVVIIYQVR